MFRLLIHISFDCLPFHAIFTDLYVVYLFFMTNIHLCSLARLRAPKWLKCPTGASFGFGGKFVSFHSCPSAPGAPNSSSEVSFLFHCWHFLKFSSIS